MTGSLFDEFGRLDGMLGSPAPGVPVEHPTDHVRVQVTVRAGAEAPPGLAHALQADAEGLLRRACEPAETTTAGEAEVEVAVHGLALDREAAERLRRLVRARVHRHSAVHDGNHDANHDGNHDGNQGAQR